MLLYSVGCLHYVQLIEKRCDGWCGVVVNHLLGAPFSCACRVCLVWLCVRFCSRFVCAKLV